METRRVSGEGSRGGPPPLSKRRITLIIDSTSCDGHGVCAELFPERVTMDHWGFPIIENEEIPVTLVDHARNAVAACPRLALHLLEERR